MARKEPEEKPGPQSYTPDRVQRFTTPDEIRFLLEQWASGDAMVSEALQFKAIEKLAELTGLGAVVPVADDANEDRPDTAKMTDAELVTWLRLKYGPQGEP
jgi:hypothetical protein